jgi:hypothetical protein
MTRQGTKVEKDGVRVIQGTPVEPITRATLVLRLWRVPGPKNIETTRAALWMVRPGRGEYVIKELIPDMELGPQAALDKAIAIAKRGDVATIHLNADLDKLPRLKRAANT